MSTITLILFFTWKFAATFPFAIYTFKLSPLKTILLANIGGIIGVILFAILSDIIILFWDKRIITNHRNHHTKKRVFTPRKRKLKALKNKYGFLGIIVLNPILLSIPIGTFPVRKYYDSKIINLGWLAMGQFIWSVIYTYFYFYIKITL